MSSTEQSEALSIGYISRQIEAALRLFKVNPAAIEGFDTTANGFFRSFLAMLIAAPFNAYQLIVSYSLAADVATSTLTTPLPEVPQVTVWLVLAMSLRYVIQWVALPVVLGLFARRLQLSHRYVPFVVAYNWATLVTSVISMVPMLLYGLGIADVATTQLLFLAVIGLILYYAWSVVVSALQIPPLAGFAVVALDILLSAFFTVVFESLYLSAA